MKRYIVSIPYPGGIMSAVREASNQEKLFESIGVDDYKWFRHYDREHGWEIRCEEDQLILLMIMGATVRGK